MAYFLLVLELLLRIFFSLITFCCATAELCCRATTSPSTACWSITFPGWSESDERPRSGSIYIVGPQKHRSLADLGKFGRPKNVRRSFKLSEDRLLSASCGSLRQHTPTFAHSRAKNGGRTADIGRRAAESVLSRAGIGLSRPNSAEQRAKIAHLRPRSGSLPGLCRVPAGICAYFRILAPRNRVDRARNVRDSSPRNSPLVGTQSGQKRGRLEAIQDDNRADQKN